jgi:hypothetical protein
MDNNHPLFGRRVKVTIGPPGQEGKVWTGLRVRFHVHKTADAQPNKLELRIYNLSSDARHFIENGAKAKGSASYAVIIQAGYAAEVSAGSLPVIFTGRLELGDSGTRGKHNHHHQGADWVTECKATDGGHITRNIVISKSFGPGTAEATIINDVAKAMGVTVGKIKGLPKRNANHGRALSGTAAAELDRLCRTHGLRWSIQDGVLHILPPGSAINPTAFIISPDTGMIGSPQRTERGLKVVTLIQGAITPGRLIDVRSADVKGIYIAEDVVQEGDTHEKPWYTTIEAIPVTG